MFRNSNVTPKWNEFVLNAESTRNEWDSSNSRRDLEQPYDALHDKHLKFVSASATGRLASSQSSSSLWRAPPLQPSDSAVGVNDRVGSSRAGTSHSAPPHVLHNPMTKPKSGAARVRLEHQQRAYQQVVLHALSTSQLADPEFLAKSKKPPEREVNALDLYERAKQRCVSLWSEINVEEDRRLHFAAKYFQAFRSAAAAQDEPSADTLHAIHEEIERSLRVRKLEKELEYLATVREGFVYRVFDLAEKSSEMHLIDVDKQLKPLLLNLRKATMDVMNGIAAWRDELGYDAIFLWRGSSYILKLSRDLDILAAYDSIVKRFPCEIVGNPLLSLDKLNPNLQVFRGEVASSKALMPVKSTMLPPILRPAGQQPDGTIIEPEMQIRAQQMIEQESALVASYLQTRPVHSFDLIDATVGDAARIKELQSIAFNPQDVQHYFYWQQHEGPELTPQERLRLAASIVIQRMYRGYRARQLARDLKKRHRAAVVIQTAQRRVSAADDVAGRRLRHLAASKIQGLARGVLTRRSLAQLKELHRQASKIQRLYRTYAAQKHVAQRRAVWYCIRKIQSWYRGHLARRAVPVVRSTLYNAAAVTIQKMWKGGTTRTTGLWVPKKIHAAVKIQCAWRCWVARRLVRKLRSAKQ